MKTIYIHHPYQFEPFLEKCKVLALGFFDGVHLGHQKVIQTAKKLAEEKKMICAVMTFDPHPSAVVKQKKTVQYITPLQEKMKAIAALGVEELYVVHFTKEFASLSPQEFIDQYVIALSVKHVVAGFDYTYGKMGRGTMETLPFHSRNEFTQTVVDKLTKDDQKVSSTEIKKRISDGEMEKVAQMLGRQYEITGVVVDGDKRGRKIGFPTANISCSINYLVPRVGVYAVQIEVDGIWYDAMCNIGYKPTFNDETLITTIEVHIINFSSTIYGKNVTVRFYTRIRDEQKFPHFEELVSQLHRDKQFAFEYFEKNKDKG
ncbi:bifunctional riboflavin kinase/FAD synthetase [Massilibacterium senegalense]|uniref:bifunctional riboflavin kinase/FAD synthetase n=1 Tax=Massilibacterium senegalense TaxID=1632858 RepID=UPI000783579F|nr:bifunctional riboflavin kinase/FAD synthetase [Massilibacterium senegalense]